MAGSVPSLVVASCSSSDATLDHPGLRADSSVMRVEIDSAESWSQLLAQVEQHGGMQVHVAPSEVPAPFASVDVTFVVAGRTHGPEPRCGV